MRFFLTFTIMGSNAFLFSTNEPRRDKTNKTGFATSMDQDQPAHPRSLIRIHAVRRWFIYLL
jgi:hypothetical protein